MLIPFVQSYQRELWEVEQRLNEYLILEMDTSSGEESGFDFIPDDDCDEITCRMIAKEFGVTYEYLNTIRYNEYLRWVARYKAVHWMKPLDGSQNISSVPEWADDSWEARNKRARKYQS